MEAMKIASSCCQWQQDLLVTSQLKDWNSFTWWEVRSFIPTWAIASRNGKYLAIPAPTVQSNVWMLENF
jgi:hypothetical protein